MINDLTFYEFRGILIIEVNDMNKMFSSVSYMYDDYSYLR